MNKYTFLSDESLKRFALTLFVFLLFELNILAFLNIITLIVLIILFRRQVRETNDIRLAEGGGILLSPLNGKFIGVESLKDKKIKRLTFKIDLLSSYGIFMPLNAEIIDYTESVEPVRGLLKTYRSEVQIQDKNLNQYCLLFQGLNILPRPYILVRSGDKGRVGGLMGHFPFGGEVFLEIPDTCEVVLKENDRVSSYQTVIAKVKELQ